MRALALIALTAASLAIASCEDNDADFNPPDENEVIVVNEDADECPRADGTPCR